jgi:hypothetical protein
MKNRDEKQIRYTLEDCLVNQRKLVELLKLVAQENRELRLNEREDFFRMLPKALLTQDAISPCSMVNREGLVHVESVQALALRLADLTSSQVMLRTMKPEQVEVTIPIADLWRFLYSKMLYYFPLAAAEALHLSGENIPQVQQGAYSFTSSEKLDVGR